MKNEQLIKMNIENLTRLVKDNVKYPASVVYVELFIADERLFCNVLYDRVDMFDVDKDMDVELLLTTDKYAISLV